MRSLHVLAAAGFLAGAAPDTGGLGFDPRPGARVPLADVLTDDDGSRLPLGVLLGAKRPAVLALGYHTCPNLCGTVRDDLAAALDAAGAHVPGDATVLVASVDPAETAADAAAAKARLGARAGGWHFLTGNASGLARAVGFRFRRDDRLAQVLHPAGLVVLAPGGMVSAYLLGVGYDGSALRDALARAGAGVVAPAPPPLLLFCFHYDAATGLYSLDVLRAMQGAAAITAVAVALWLARAHRAGRRA